MRSANRDRLHQEREALIRVRDENFCRYGSSFGSLDGDRIRAMNDQQLREIIAQAECATPGRL